MADDTEEEPDPDNEHQDESGDSSKDKRTSIAIELTPSQIDRVIRGATGAGNMSVLLSGQIDRQQMLAHKSEIQGDPQTSMSLLNGLLVIAALPAGEDYIGVVEISKALDLSPSTTHRYLATLLRFGLAERDASSRKYRLAR